MTPSEVPFGKTIFIEVEGVVGSLPPAFAAGREVTLRHQVGDVVRLTVPGIAAAGAEVRGRDPHAAAQLDELLERSWGRVVGIADRKDSRLVLRIQEFPSRAQWPAGISLGVRAAMLRNPLGLHGATAGEIAEHLRDRLALVGAGDGEPARIFVSAADEGAADGVSFHLHGEALIVDVAVKNDRLELVGAKRSNLPPPARVWLIETEVEFVAEPRALSAVAQGQIAALTIGTKRYLQLWRQYSEFEEKRIRRRKEQIGEIKYASAEVTPDNTLRFELAEPEESAAGLNALREACAKADQVLEARSEKSRRAATGICRVDGISADGRRIVLLPATDGTADRPPESGILTLSQRGHEVAQERREHALQRIQNGNCPMPQLGLIIEDAVYPEQRLPWLDPNTPAMRAQFYGGNPTDKQLRAVNIAINTPDIALIQGPPGTGKTQVIAAIVKRLEELADTDASTAGLFLISSYQHVAVEEVQRRIKPFGLPPVKSGINRRAVQERNQTDDPVERWRQETIELIRRRLAELDESPALQAFRQLHRQLQEYVAGFLRLDETAAVLEDAARLAGPHVGKATHAALRQTAARVRADRRAQLDETPRDRAYRAAYALRFLPESFADDGPVTAMKAELALGAVETSRAAAAGDATASAAALPDGQALDPADRALLREAQYAGNSPAPALLARLGALRDKLLAEFAPDRRPAAVRFGPRRDVGEALGGAVKELRDRVYASEAGKALVLDEYLAELENSPWRVAGALQRYSAARAETCQGCASRRVVLSGPGGREGYETVIVDEAARANPLDLMIPMAQARRRVILVGDQKQLPHSLDPEIEDDLRDFIGDSATLALHQPLFERLFNDLKQRDEKGGPPRTVRLDTQFRMHSKLGDFVSRVFYNHEVGSRDELDANFAHGLEEVRKDGRECVALWIDVPSYEISGRSDRRDGERIDRKSRSRFRDAEIAAIAAAVRRFRPQLEKRTDARPIKIGVISFYGEQVKRLANRRLDTDEQVRVQVGTVDSVQGQEFAIVFVSMVRSNSFGELGDAASEEEVANLARRRYGFLTLENRMCVALSRQKWLLVLVGDRRMLTYPDAKRHIGPLVEFDALCDEDSPYGLRWRWRSNELLLP
jgi:hypothetical protein